MPETHSVELTDEDRERLIHALAAYQYELEDNAVGDVSEKVEWTWEMRRSEKVEWTWEMRRRLSGAC